MIMTFFTKQEGNNKEEIAKLMAAGFIRELLHPSWLANPVLTQKKNMTEWRMCIDYTNLNKKEMS